MKRTLLLSSITAMTILSGCSVMAPIGKEDFTCPNEKKGGVCAGPRTIYELTNSHANLENLDDSEEFDGYVIKTDEDGNTYAEKREKSNQENTDSVTTARVGEIEQHGVRAVLINAQRHQYQPRDHAQQSEDAYQTPSVIERRHFAAETPDAFHRWPTTPEPLAPEPLGVLEPPKVMRILVNSYKDSVGNLHLPGYVYVQVEAETWAFGESSALRPQRVIPTQLIQGATQADAERDYRTQGVSPLEHTER